MRTLNTRSIIHSFIAVNILCCSACSQEGAAKFEDQLVWAANRMNVFRDEERAVVYTHDKQAAYWVFALPAGTTAAPRTASALSERALKFLDECLSTNEPVLAVIDSDRMDCVHPFEFPEVHAVFAVSKQAGDSATAVVRRMNSGALELASVN